MALNYQQPRDPGEEVRRRWAGGLEGIFDAYQASKQSAQERGRLAQQDALAAEARANAERDRQGAGLLQYGFDPRLVTPEIMAQAQGAAPGTPTNPNVPSGAFGQGSPALPAPAEHPLAGPVRAFLEKKRSAASLASQGAQADIDLKQSQIKENEAQAAALGRTPSGASAPQTINIKGVDYIQTTSANGTPHFQPIPARQPTQSEFVARGFADKAQEGNDALETVIGRGLDVSSVGTAIQSNLPSMFQGQNVKALENAKILFGNAIARRESGATIKDDEMARYNLMYFPQPNDGPEILAQKKENRRIAIQNLANEGRRAPSALGSGGGGMKPLSPAGGAPIALTGAKAARLAELRAKAGR